MDGEMRINEEDADAPESWPTTCCVQCVCVFCRYTDTMPSTIDLTIDFFF